MAAPITNVMNTQLRGLVDKVGGLLKPQKAFTQVQSYDQFAAPQRQVFDTFAQTAMRPEFEQNTLNPYRRATANQAAASGNFRMGNFNRNLQSDIKQKEVGYANTLDTARQQYEQYINNLYNERLGKYYSSPGAFTNF